MTPTRSGRPAAQPPEQGVLFPLVEGRRSSQFTARTVLADAVRGTDPQLAADIDAAGNWHRDYVRHVVAVEAAATRSAKAALLIAADGLDALHRQLVFARDDQELSLHRATRLAPRQRFDTVTVTGDNSHPNSLVIPYAGQSLSGTELSRRLDSWVAAGVVEESFMAAVRLVQDHPEWLDARDLVVVLAGAAAEMGPLAMLSQWGATVAALDLPRPHLWQQILSVARAGSGRLLVPVDPGRSVGGHLADAAGIDLLSGLPEARAWLETLDGNLVLGGYAYADGASFVRAAAAVDALFTDVCEHQPVAAVSYLASPTDAFAIPAEIADAVRAGGPGARRGRRLAAPARLLTGGRAFTANYRSTVESETGDRWALADSLIAQQGPNYALAKRLQRWRAMLCRESMVTSMNVAPATRTRSVTKNRVLAAAYAGAGRYGVEIFDPQTSSALMAAKLLHDLRNPAAVSQPAVALGHPLEMFVEGAAHGGLWRLPWEPRSVLPLAAVEGLARRH